MILSFPVIVILPRHDENHLILAHEQYWNYLPGHDHLRVLAHLLGVDIPRTWTKSSISS